jgi:Uma2 family endonuclease
MAIQQIQQVEQAEQTEPKRRLFTLDEYERMIEAGVFQEDEHLELIRGEIVEIPPIGFDHGSGVSNLVTALAAQVGKAARLWPQGPLQIAPDSRPEPDFALLKPQNYSKKRPVTPSDVLLIIEVSDTTLQYDHKVKGPLYAQAGIPEYWIVNLPDDVIEVYTEPSGGAYRSTRKVKRGQTLALPAELGAIEVSEVLGEGVG